MGTREQDLQVARDYLRDNGELRAAIGAGESAVLDPHYLGTGEHNLNFWFSNPESECKYVLRINVAKQPFHDDQVGYEYRALRALEDCGCTPQPFYLDNSSSAPREGAMVIGFCEGDELDFDNLRAGDLRCVAQIMANVHAVPAREGCRVFRPQDPLRALFEECLQRFEAYRTSAFEDPRVTKWVEGFIASAERAARVPCSPEDCTHIVNTETLPSHFLISESAAVAAAANAAERGFFCERPGTFVDWERPIIGEVAQDVAYFVSPTSTFWDSDFMFPAGDIEAFVEDYWRAVDGRFERGSFDGRFIAWRKMTALRSATWCCRALVTYSQPGVHKTERTIKKLPIYLSDEFMEMLAKEVFAL